jgi:hypothetical protein
MKISDRIPRHQDAAFALAARAIQSFDFGPLYALCPDQQDARIIERLTRDWIKHLESSAGLPGSADEPLRQVLRDCLIPVHLEPGT